MGSETSKPTKTLAVNGNTSPGLRRGSSGDAFESAVVTATVISKSNGSTGTVNGNGTIRNAIGLPPAIKVGASISYNENLLSAGIFIFYMNKISITFSQNNLSKKIRDIKTDPPFYETITIIRVWFEN